MGFELHRTDGVDKIGPKIEQPKNPILSDDRRWADYIRNFRNDIPWEGSHVHPAYEGLEFQFAGSPGKVIGHSFEGKEDELLKMDLDPNQKIGIDLEGIAAAIRTNRAYSEKYARGGVTMSTVKSKNPEGKVPVWVGKITHEASGKVFRDVPAIHDYLREMAERNQEK